MYIIELMLKGNPAAISVQKKEEADATELYKKLLAGLQKGDPRMLELSCDRTGKQTVVLTEEICAIQLTPKSGPSNPMGARPGFLSQIDNKS